MRGILLCNLGTPSAPTIRAVRQYLAEFLHDSRVVELTRWLWCPILHGLILRTRPARSARLYQSIWTEVGSPLAVILQKQAERLQQILPDYTIVPAMRYGQPSIANGLNALKHCDEIIILPLYPQYSATTSASTFDAVTKYFKTQRVLPHITFIRDYHDKPQYIQALANSIKQHWEAHGRGEKLVMSFHGLPQQFADKGDIYPKQCEQTVALLAQALALSSQAYMLTYQSRLGPAAWLQPYTDKTLEQLAKEGVQSVDVICPGFSADCLETLEEIAVENRQIFLKAGGERYQYIPALNESDAHIALMASLSR